MCDNGTSELPDGFWLAIFIHSSFGPPTFRRHRWQLNYLQLLTTLIGALPLKTTPLDILPIPIMKLCHAELSAMIAIVDNRSFEIRISSFDEGRPHQPLHQEERPWYEWVQEFQTITNLSKISPRLVLRRLRPQLMLSPNYCHLQYCSRHSMETALGDVIDDILVCIDKGKMHYQPQHLHSVQHGKSWSTAGKAEIRVRHLRQCPPVDRLITCRQELHHSCRFVHLFLMHL